VEKRLSDIREVPPSEQTDEDVDKLVNEAEQYLGPVNVTPAMRDAIRSRRIKVVQSGSNASNASSCEGTPSQGCCTTSLYTADAATRLGCGPFCGTALS